MLDWGVNPGMRTLLSTKRVARSGKRRSTQLRRIIPLTEKSRANISVTNPHIFLGITWRVPVRGDRAAVARPVGRNYS